MRFSVNAHTVLNFEHKRSPLDTNFGFFFFFLILVFGFGFSIMKCLLEQCLPVVKKQTSWFRCLCVNTSALFAKIVQDDHVPPAGTTCRHICGVLDANMEEWEETESRLPSFLLSVDSGFFASFLPASGPQLWLCIRITWEIL